MYTNKKYLLSSEITAKTRHGKCTYTNVSYKGESKFLRGNTQHLLWQHQIYHRPRDNQRVRHVTSRHVNRIRRISPRQY